jgi:hypothetical protein
MANELAVEAPPLAGQGTASGSEVLSALRGNPNDRPVVDAALAGGLREWLEDGFSTLRLDPEKPLVLDKKTLRRAHSDQGRTAVQEITHALAIGLVMDALFRQLVTVGHIDDPMRDGLESLRIDPRRADAVAFIESLEGRERVDFEDEIETQTAITLSRWPRLSPGWLPRTQERIAIPLAGGGIVLVGIIDLIIGAPSRGRASVEVIDVKSGRPRLDDREDLRYYALLETLRSGAPPFRTATFYTRTGQVDFEDIVDEVLTCTVRSVLSAVEQLVGVR